MGRETITPPKTGKPFRVKGPGEKTSFIPSKKFTPLTQACNLQPASLTEAQTG